MDRTVSPPSSICTFDTLFILVLYSAYGCTVFSSLCHTSLEKLPYIHLFYTFLFDFNIYIFILYIFIGILYFCCNNCALTNITVFHVPKYLFLFHIVS